MYWDINKTLSYNKLFNFIIGNRGGGKTYGTKEWCINRFKKYHEQFIYVRRYDSELKLIKERYLDDIKDSFEKDITFKKPNKFIFDDEIMGYCFALSQAAHIKSNSFPAVQTIIFDEFLPEQNSHYLREEVFAFLNFYETVARLREVRVFFLANAISIANPYFSFFHLSCPFQTNIMSNGDCLVELVADNDYIQMKESTRFGQLIKNTEFANYSIKNEFILDHNSFVEKMKGNCSYKFTIAYKGNLYGVWFSKDKNSYWLSTKVEESSSYILSTTIQDHAPNRIDMNTPGFNNFIPSLVLAFNRGCLRFESLKIKSDFIKIAGL